MKRRNGICILTSAIAMLAMLFGATPTSATTPLIIPQPAEVRSTDGRFAINRQTLVVASGEAAGEARKLVDFLAPAMGFRLPLSPVRSSGSVIEMGLLASLRERLGREGYKLSVRSDGVRIQAAEPAGLFYGVQTLRQLLSPAIYRSAPAIGTEWILPGVEITDYPRFEWRGLLIDPARHFIPKRDVMRYLDAMALHKFNRLQIHFTDGQGWRIAIEKYPLLTEIGSRWHNTLESRNDQGKIYGGYYTPEDIHELVGYAAERYVTIVPEIEMPFHAGAAIVAYPKLGFDPEGLAGLPLEQRRLRAGNLVVPRPYTVAFMKDVLDEIVELFPSVHIHIGGDEAHVESWGKLPEMQERMKALNLADVHELHSWFIKQIDSHLTQHGRKMVGWDEILQGGLAEGATVMSWRGVQGGIAAARAGHDVVMAPTSHTYFDYRQSQDQAADPPALGNSVITLAKAYSFEPIPAELNAGQAKRILGGQGQLWGELIPDEHHREFQTYPRACALIETLWSPKARRDFGGFHQRLSYHLQRLDAAGVYYRKLDPRPEFGMTVSDLPVPALGP